MITLVSHLLSLQRPPNDSNSLANELQQGVMHEKTDSL